MPNDFASVFRVRGGGELYRRQGDLYAVFPESRYSVNKEGQILPMIPPDTVFYIGRPALLDPDAPEARPPSERLVRLRIDTRAAPPRRTARLQPTSDRSLQRPPSLDARSGAFRRGPLPAIVSDEAYRTRRLHELMRYAARGRSSSSK